jgi:hypothetical protein
VETIDTTKGPRLYVDMDIEFIRYKNVWCLIGPDWALPAGKVINVYSRREQSDTSVLVGGHIAERVVKHTGRDAGRTTRFVIARVEKTSRP